MGKSIDPVSTIIGGVGSVFGGVGSAIAQDSANETNLQIARETNQTSKDIAAANNANQEKLLRQNNLYNAAESQKAWDRSVQMFNMENQYNSPIEQLKRYQEAGINPGVAFGGSLGSASSAAASGNVPAAATAGSSGVSPSMPSLVAPTMMPVNFATGILDGMEKFANTYKTIAEANKTGKEVKWFDDRARAEIDKLFKDAKVQESVANLNAIQKNWNEFKYALDVMYSGSERQLGVKETIKRIDNLGVQYYNACLTGENIKADSLLKNMQSLLTSQEAKNLKDQLPYLIANLQETNKLLKAQQATESSKQAANYASADDSRASAAEHRKGTEVKEEERIGKGIENVYKPARQEAEINNINADSDAKRASSYDNPYKTGTKDLQSEDDINSRASIKKSSLRFGKKLNKRKKSVKKR